MGGGAAAMLQEETNHTAAARLASTLGIGEETWASMLELKGGKGGSSGRRRAPRRRSSGGKGGGGGGSFAAPVMADGRHPTGTHNLNIGSAYKIADKICKAVGRSLGRNCIP